MGGMALKCPKELGGTACRGILGGSGTGAGMGGMVLKYPRELRGTACRGILGGSGTGAGAVIGVLKGNSGWNTDGACT
jgi:hypothetical protein